MSSRDMPYRAPVLIAPFNAPCRSSWDMPAESNPEPSMEIEPVE